MIVEDERQSIVDAEHLKLLVFAYVIEGATFATFSVFGLFFAAEGASVGAEIVVPPVQGQPPPPDIGWFLGFLGLAMFGVFFLCGSLKLLCAHRLWARRSRALCFVVAALSRVAVPYGTAIGVWTLLVLRRPSVAQLFSPFGGRTRTPSALSGGAA